MSCVRLCLQHRKASGVCISLLKDNNFYYILEIILSLSKLVGILIYHYTKESKWKQKSIIYISIIQMKLLYLLLLCNRPHSPSKVVKSILINDTFPIFFLTLLGLLQGFAFRGILGRIFYRKQSDYPDFFINLLCLVFSLSSGLGKLAGYMFML